MHGADDPPRDGLRRTLLSAFLAGGMCLGGPSLAYTADTTSGVARRPEGRRARALILLWLDGGPSQIDTFDPKPGRETGGEFRAIETRIRNVRFSEHLPRLAARADRLAVIRTLHTKEGDHGRGAYLMHTGYAPQAGLVHPSFASLITRETAVQSAMPEYVNVGSMYVSRAPGRDAGFLPQRYAPFVVTDTERPAAALSVLDEASLRRAALMRSLDARFVATHPSQNVERRQVFFEQAAALHGSAFERALQIEHEPPERVAAYAGPHRGVDAEFGRACLTARRLVQAGVRCVEVGLGGWDTHADNFNATRRLAGILDVGFSALLDDLQRSGLLESTLVVCMGEFGRTPAVNAARGRDHWSRNFCAVLAGGGIRGGMALGETGIDGTDITADPVGAPNLVATVYHAFGIDPAGKYQREDTRLVKYTNDGVPLAGIFV